MDGKGAKSASLVVNFVYETTTGADLGSCLLLLSKSWLAATKTGQEERSVRNCCVPLMG